MLFRVLGLLSLSWLALPTLAQEAPAAPEAPAWYTFSPKSDATPSEISLADWLEKPAGAHGRILREGENLLYNGKPIKLWGLNLCYGACVPPHETADKRAQFYAKFGINAVRFHKFTESNYQTGDSVVEFSAEAIDKLDYQIAALKKAGIYSTLSVHFGNAMLGPADVKYLPWIEEIGKFGGAKKATRLQAVPSAMFYSPELQNLHIAQIVNLLKHKNAFTGKTYAEDPAIAFIECVNEQSILFHSSMTPLLKYPTLRKQVGQRFSDWLKKKYASQAGLAKAWGDKALDSFEHEGFKFAKEILDEGTVLPVGSPWFWEPAQLNGSQAFRKQRLLDTLEFLTLLETECYAKYAKALREAGYKGEILGSNWQAGSAYSHFANLYADSTLGTIDRHNYFGGGGKGRAFNTGSMLQNPGSGMLSTGMQQVSDRPFMLSEWIHCFPTEWGAEGPAIIGAYGLGLQGWDASFMFQNGDSGGFLPALGGTWEVTAPQVLGVFPAVARHIHRADIKESPVTATRNVHVPSLYLGKLSFEDKVVQGYDVKELSSSTAPAAALAAVRTVVAFTDTYKDTPAFDLTPYLKNGLVVSATKQLKWKPGHDQTDGFFTIDTPATQALVGFARGQSATLENVTIAPTSRFGAIYLTAQGKADTLVTGKKALVVAMARARNTGADYGDQDDSVRNRGKAPIVLEPVTATLTFKRPVAKITALDHDGHLTDKTVPLKDNALNLDTGRDQTPYYLVEFK